MTVEKICVHHSISLADLAPTSTRHFEISPAIGNWHYECALSLIVLNGQLGNAQSWGIGTLPTELYS